MNPRVQQFLSHPAHWVAMGLGAGLSPKAPGTVGTLWAWAAYGVLQTWFDTAQMGWVILLALGVGWNFLYIGGSTLATKAWAPEEKTRAQAALAQGWQVLRAPFDGDVLGLHLPVLQHPAQALRAQALAQRAGHLLALQPQRLRVAGPGPVQRVLRAGPPPQSHGGGQQEQGEHREGLTQPPQAPQHAQNVTPTVRCTRSLRVFSP